MRDKTTEDKSTSTRESDSKQADVGEILRSDGGQKSTPFDVTAELQETRRDRYLKLLDRYIRTPFSIMRQDWRAIVGLTIVSIYVLAGTVVSSLVEPTTTGEGASYVQPFQTWEFPLGTNNLGHDLFAQTVHSTGPILVMMTSGALFIVIMGTGLGLLAGYKGGMTDTIVSTITDIFINIPGLPLVIVLSVILEPANPIMVGILLAVAKWAGLARAIRSQVLTLRSESFTEAARALDVSTPKILTKEILPHLMPYITVNLVNAARTIIFSAVALYFLGVLPFTDANWGVMLNQAYTQGAIYRPAAVHWLLIPMAAISVLSIGLLLLAQSLDRVFNPRARARHEDTVVEEDDESGGTEMMGQV